MLVLSGRNLFFDKRVSQKFAIQIDHYSDISLIRFDLVSQLQPFSDKSLENLIED
jgi:hypothetical protein